MFLVSGLGLIGLLTAQLLKAHGCNVLALDPDKNKCSLAESFGIHTFHLTKNLTHFLGVWRSLTASVSMVY